MLALKDIPWSDLRVGRRVKFVTYESDSVRTGTIAVSKDGSYLQVMRDDGIRGGGKYGAWNINKTDTSSKLEFLDEAPVPVEEEREYADEESISTSSTSACCFCGEGTGPFFCSTRLGTDNDERDICLSCAQYAVRLLEGKTKPAVAKTRAVVTETKASVVRHLIP